MKRLLNILVFFCLMSSVLAQEDTRVIDSLQEVLVTQEGRDKVLTMIELTWEFYDISYDDCLDWGEKAIKEAKKLGFTDLEADAMYALGMQFSFHGDLDLAQEKLKNAFVLHEAVGNEKKAFEDLWNQARYEQKFGNVDTAFQIYEKVMAYAENLHDSQAMAQTYSNMAIIQYQKLDFLSAETNFQKSLDLYKSIEDTLMVIRTNANIASVYMENGKTREARSIFLDIIPKMEEIGDYGWLMNVYKNYGQLFKKDPIDFDSASYYFEKSHEIIGLLTANGVKVPVANEVDLLVEMGNTDYNQGNYNSALEKYLDAFELAESTSYISGQMLACMGLGAVCSYLAMPSKSLYYLNLFFELESKSGIAIAHSSMRFPLMLTSARLGKFSELESELKDFEDEYVGQVRENVDLTEQIDVLQAEMSDLFQQYESQNNQIETLQTQRNHYRLAFFGLLAIMLFAWVLFVCYKIVRKNRIKMEKG